MLVKLLIAMCTSFMQAAAYEATIKQLLEKLQAGKTKCFKLEQVSLHSICHSTLPLAVLVLTLVLICPSVEPHHIIIIAQVLVAVEMQPRYIHVQWDQRSMQHKS